MMKNGRKAGKRFMLLLVLMAAAASMSAQQRFESPTAARGSNNAQISLIARMPETLTLALNVNEIKDTNLVADSSMSINSPVALTAASVTATWVLAPGRSQIVTLAHLKLQPARVLVALANSIDIPPYGGGVLGSPLRLHYLRLPPTIIFNMKLPVLVSTPSHSGATKTLRTFNLKLTKSTPRCS